MCFSCVYLSLYLYVRVLHAACLVGVINDDNDDGEDNDNLVITIFLSYQNYNIHARSFIK